MKLKQKILEKTDNKFGKYKWYGKMKNPVCRTLVFSVFGAIVTLGFAIYNGVVGVIGLSSWHGAFSGYLTVLALQRFLLIAEYAVVGKACKTEESLRRGKIKIYLANAAVFLPIAIALAVIILLLINLQKPAVSGTTLAIATAAYAFYKISMAIINFTRDRLHRDALIQTVHSVNLVDAVASIIMLESTLITAFGSMDSKMYILVAVTGMLGCLFTLGVGIFMIASAVHRLKAPVENKQTP